MQLWTAHLPCLKGFYAADAYVAARDREHALELIEGAVQAYILKEMTEYGYVSAVGTDKDDPDWGKLLADLLLTARVEARETLRLVQENALLVIKV